MKGKWCAQGYREDIAGTDNQRWRAPDNASDNLTAGRGLFAYFFSDITGDSRYNYTFPDTLEIQGQEFEGTGSSFDFGVTDTGWNLVGTLLQQLSIGTPEAGQKQIWIM